MSRSGIRPHVWMYQGEIPHQQHIAWLKSKSQAAYRDEEWQLTVSEYQQLWEGMWHLKGRSNHNFCMTRKDHKAAWSLDNCEVISRLDHLRRKKVLQHAGK